ncbi:MAG: 16S rRNA (cytosine(967)-C(5))-methyltransferase RsmB [Lachnospiraceae bacterium]
MNEREIILDILYSIEKEQQYSHLALRKTLMKYQYMEKPARSFITRVCEGTLEHQIRLDYIIDSFSKTKVRKMKPLIRCIMRMSVYQLYYMDHVPESAICNEAVKLTRKRGFSGLSGFVNGVLRNIARGKELVVFPSREQSFVKYASVEYSIPEWILEQWLEQYDEETVETIAKALNEQRPTTIRVNTSRISPEDCKQALEQQGMLLTPATEVSGAFYLEQFDYLDAIPEFEQGLFVVQDESSMMAVQMAQIEKGMHVVDVCAAPGGKSLYAADIMNGTGQILSRDLTDRKVEYIRENRKRCGFEQIQPEVWDATVDDERLHGWADVVLADLPCSGLGVMGRKKDIKYRMTPKQQEELVSLQREILSVVQKYVKSDGVLLYSTCTIHRAENEEMIEWFTKQYPYEVEEMKQWLPGVDACDGFFACRLRRK